MIIDGRRLAVKKEKILRQKIARLKNKPRLAVVLIGDDPASKIYIDLKFRAAQRVGVDFELHHFPTHTSLQSIEAVIQAKNPDPHITGMMIQLPIQLSESAALINQIAPEKDVDCLTNYNLSKLIAGKAIFLPATLKAVLTIIHNSRFIIHDSGVCVVGATGFIGQPLADYLELLGAKVKRCNSPTPNLSEHTRRADILISATGVPNLIKKEMIKPGALVIDIGSPHGDVAFDEVKDIAGAITPVPGGVGPLTVISLLENVFLAAQNLGRK